MTDRDDLLDIEEDARGIAKARGTGDSVPEERMYMRQLAHEEGMRRMEMGLIGKFIGGLGEKESNIVSVVLATAFLVLVLGIFYDTTGLIAPSMLSIVTLTLGYMFGSTRR